MNVDTVRSSPHAAPPMAGATGMIELKENQIE